MLGGHYRSTICSLGDSTSRNLRACLTEQVATKLSVEQRRRFALMIGLSWVMIALCILILFYRNQASTRTGLLIAILAVGSTTSYMARHWKDGFTRKSN
jgi:thiamine transporter ThiT